MKFFRQVLAISLLLSGSMIAAKKHKNKSNFEHIKHNIQLQLSDAYGYPVDGTQFWVPLDIIKQGPLVTIQIPLINFQTGQCSLEDPFCPTFPPGGYLFTSDGFLPEYLRPTSLVPVSIIGASNNGMSPVFSFTQSPTTLPVPPSGYIVSLTNGGAIQVQQAGTFGNVIAPGPQILMPCTLTYVIDKKQKLCKNVTLSNGATNVTEFTYNSSLRDSHINDAFDGVAVWSWVDNSMIDDKASGVMNVMISVADVDEQGKISNVRTTQLTNFVAGDATSPSFDTACAIVRDGPYKGNIVVSYYIASNFHLPGSFGLPYITVSSDGGYTWPINGPLTVQPTGNPSAMGDWRGVAADKFGNIWALGTNLLDDMGNLINQPYITVSSDGGQTFELAYTVPFLPGFIPGPIPGISLYDFPQMCFGGLGDGSGAYGMWFSLEYVSPYGLPDVVPVVGFIPINGLGSFGAGTTLALQEFTNTQNGSSITASADGRVWAQVIDGYPANGFIFPLGLRYKSPGAIDSNYAGIFDMAKIFLPAWTGAPDTISYMAPPNGGYFFALQGNIFDDARQALYAIFCWQVPDFSQNMQIYFIISRDNGLTWSDPIPVNSSNFANRGFPTMALDTVTRNLVFGWYDGRNTDPNSPTAYQTIEYMAAVIPAKTLDELVNAIPLSNPTFEVPA